MHHTNDTVAISSGESIRDIAFRLMRMSEVIHRALRQLTSTITPEATALSPYALLTEEYALRARVNILLIEAERLARPGFPVSQGAVVEILDQAETALSQANSLDDMNELIAGLLLFTSSIISRRNGIIAVLLENVRQTVVDIGTTRQVVADIGQMPTSG